MNYLLYGEETYNLEKRMEALMKSLLGDEYQMSAVQYDAMQTPMPEILEDAYMLPFFSDHKVIVIQNPFFLTASLHEGAECKEELLLQYLNEENPTTTVIFRCDYPLDERRKLVKAFRKLCHTEEFKLLDSPAMRQYITKELQQNHVQITDDALQLLCQSIGLQLHSVHQELAKLILFGNMIDHDIVLALVSKPLEDNIFELVNAVMDKNMKKAFSVYNDFLLLNKEPLAMIGALASQFRFCYQVACLQSRGMSNDAIADELRCKAFRVTKAKQSIRRATPEQMLHILHQLATLDQNIKNGKMDKKSGFEFFLIQIGMENQYGVTKRVV